MGELGAALTKAANTVGKYAGGNARPAEDPGIIDIGQPSPLNDFYQNVSNDPSVQAGGVDISMPQDNYAPQMGSEAQNAAPPPPAPEQQDNSYTPYDNLDPARAGASTGSGEDISVTGDSWQPHHESVIAQIGDYFLHNVFKHVNDRRNMTEALQGMDKDPQQAISRVRKFNPDAAYKMQHDQDELHQDDDYRAARTDVMRGELQDRMANTLGAIQNRKNPSAVYAKMLPVLQQQAQRWGIPDLPSSYDEDAVSAYRYSGYKTKDQIAQQNMEGYRNSRLKQLQQTVDNNAGYHSQRLKQFDAGNKEDERHDRAMENKPTATEKGPSYRMTKYGPGVLKKGGTLMDVQINGETHTYENVGPNRWKLVPEDDE